MQSSKESVFFFVFFLFFFWFFFLFIRFIAFIWAIQPAGPGKLCTKKKATSPVFFKIETISSVKNHVSPTACAPFKCYSFVPSELREGQSLWLSAHVASPFKGAQRDSPRQTTHGAEAPALESSLKLGEPLLGMVF